MTRRKYEKPTLVRQAALQVIAAGGVSTGANGISNGEAEAAAE